LLSTTPVALLMSAFGDYRGQRYRRLAGVVAPFLLLVLCSSPALADAGLKNSDRPAPTKLTIAPRHGQARSALQPGSAAPKQLPLQAGVGANLQVSAPDGNEYSSINAAYDPSSPSNLQTASDIPTALQVGAFASGDGGSHWNSTNPPLPTGAPNHFATEPAAAYGGAGKAYVASVAVVVAGTSVSTQLVVSSSTDRGSSWTPATVIEPAARAPEKPMMTVDPTSGPYRGRLYTAYDVIPSATSEPLVVASSDDGVTWHRTQVWDSGGDFGAVPAVGADGAVNVAWDDFCGAPGPTATCPSPSGRLLFARSIDGGANFSGSPGLITTTGIGFGVNLFNYGAYGSSACGTQPAVVTPDPTLDVDRGGSSHRGSLYVAWGDRPAGSQYMHIYLSRSTDAGAHWTSPVQIDTGNTRDAWEPAIGVDQSTGVVTLSWYDRRDDVNNKLYRVYYTE
jgi:hypothetical protein